MTPVVKPKSEDNADPKAWAWRLRKRELMLDRSLSIVQKAMWRAALHTELASERSAEHV